MTDTITHHLPLNVHPTIVSAYKNWIQFLHWLSPTRAVLRCDQGFTHFKRFDTLARALRRAGVHYFEYEGFLIWELGPKPEKPGLHVHQYLIEYAFQGTEPHFSSSAKQQLTADEVHQLTGLNPAVLVGRNTFPDRVPLVVANKTKQPNNRRRKANQSTVAALDILTPHVPDVGANLNTIVPDDTAYHYGAEDIFGCTQQQPLHFYPVQQMYSDTTAFLQSPESCSSPLSAHSMSESDGLDDSSFQPCDSLYPWTLFNSIQNL